MWILMKKTYSGKLGLFEAGRKFDLPEATVKKLPRSCYEVTCAPWDEQKDTQLVELNRLKAERQKCIDRALMFKERAAQCRSQAKQLYSDAKAYIENGKTAVELAAELSAKIEKLEPIIESRKAAEQKNDSEEQENGKEPEQQGTEHEEIEPSKDTADTEGQNVSA